MEWTTVTLDFNKLWQKFKWKGWRGLLKRLMRSVVFWKVFESELDKETSTRKNFVKAFGKGEALRIEAAALSHANGINDINKGSDSFKWAILICIGYQCLVDKRFRKSHGIKTPWLELEQWIKNYGDLESHDGDCDYLAAAVGKYNEFVTRRAD